MFVFNIIICSISISISIVSTIITRKKRKMEWLAWTKSDYKFNIEEHKKLVKAWKVLMIIQGVLTAVILCNIVIMFLNWK